MALLFWVRRRAARAGEAAVSAAGDGPRRAPRRPRLAHLPHHVVLVLATALALCPLLFMLMTALKTDEQYLDDTLGLPWPLTFGNFREALHGGEFFIWFKNSVILTLGAVVVSTVAAALCAFAIAQMRFRGQNLLLSINIALMIVPPVVLLIPLFAQFADLGLVSTYRGVIIIYAGLTAPFSVYLLTSFFRTIPDELIESAMADGASHFRILWQIVAPLSAPGARDADRRQLALGLERAADRARVPARGRAEDADGRRDRVPGPLLAGRARAHGRACCSRRCPCWCST